MEQSLQKFNAKQNLLKWSERIASCRNSGMSVREWCKVNGIPPSTYYNQQRKVFEASKSSAVNEQKPQFTGNRQLSPTLPDSPTHDKITPTIPAKWNGLRWST